MTDRFTMPVPGASTPIRFPPAVSERLANGLDVRAIPHATVPAFTAMLVILRGTVDDPADRPGLASLTGDLLDEGAGPRDAIALADAFARIGAQVEVDVGPDATWLSVTALDRHLDLVLDLLADIVVRPHLSDADFARVRELRVSRLRQLSQSAGTMADRVFVNAVFQGHPYGHGALGTTASLEGMEAEDARRFWASIYTPGASTLIVGGAVRSQDVMRAAARAFGSWRGAGQPAPLPSLPVVEPDRRVWLVDRPGAPQSELRIGHTGPARSTAAYHALVTLNALLGGQFTSRINRRLREEKGITYGARTAFDFRRIGGAFSCETSVQADATAVAVSDVLAECEAIRRHGAVTSEELAHAQASLTRGYVRHFETAGQLVRAAAQLVTYSLDADTFDRFVSAVDAVTPAEVARTAAAFIRPSDATIAVVGDASVCREPLEALGRTVILTAPEF